MPLIWHLSVCPIHLHFFLSLLVVGSTGLSTPLWALLSIILRGLANVYVSSVDIMGRTRSMTTFHLRHSGSTCYFIFWNHSRSIFYILLFPFWVRDLFESVVLSKHIPSYTKLSQLFPHFTNVHAKKINLTNTTFHWNLHSLNNLQNSLFFSCAILNWVCSSLLIPAQHSPSSPSLKCRVVKTQASQLTNDPSCSSSLTHMSVNGCLGKT